MDVQNRFAMCYHPGEVVPDTALYATSMHIVLFLALLALSKRQV